MWKVSQYQKTGLRNEACGLKCQDYVYHMEKGEVQVITLADAEGDTDLARLGAKQACLTLATLLSEHFQELYDMEEDVVQFNVIINAQSALYELCDKYGADMEDFHSTLLGLAVDGDRFLCVHLGDGYVGIRRAEMGMTISYPENGVNKSRTYLTSGHGIGKHLRVCRGEMKDIDRFILISDGWNELAGQGDPFAQEGFLEKAYELSFKDDVSFIALHRE